MFKNRYKSGLKTIYDLITNIRKNINFFEGEKHDKNFDCIYLDNVASEIHTLNNLVIRTLQSDMEQEELSTEDYSEIQLMLNYINKFIEEEFWDSKARIIVSSQFSLINSVDDLFFISKEIKYHYSFTQSYINQLKLLDSIIYENEDITRNGSLSTKKLHEFTKQLSTLDTFVNNTLSLNREKIKLSKQNYSSMVEIINSIREWVYNIHTPSNVNDKIISTPLLLLAEDVLDLSLVFEIPEEYLIIISEGNDSSLNSKP